MVEGKEKVAGEGRRSGPRRGADSERRCLISREAGSRDGLIRFVLDPDGIVVPDLDEKLPGRGAWLTADREVLDKAVRRNPFPRAFRGPAQMPDDLAGMLSRLLQRKCLQLLGMALGAGQLTLGFDKVAARAAAGQVGAMFLASDASENAREKALRLAGSSPVIACFTRDELGLALGRENVVHAAVAPGRLADRLLREVQRLLGVSGGARDMDDERQAIDE